MEIKANVQGGPERVLVSLSPETLDNLADLVITKLTAKNGKVLLPKQGVVGSNPITRSTDLDRGPCLGGKPAYISICNKGPCLSKNSLVNQLKHYRLHAQAGGFSTSTIDHVQRCLKFFSDFMGGIDDVGRISADDLCRFIVFLRGKTAWD